MDRSRARSRARRGVIYATGMDARLRRGPAGEHLGDVLRMVNRSGAEQRLTYLPAGPAHRGIRWQRVAGVPTERCIR